MRVPDIVLSLAFICLMRTLNIKSSVLKNLINIPIDAKPGHIITVLNSGGKYAHTEILPSPDVTDLTDYISLSHAGVLSLKSNVTQLAGKTIPITIQHESPIDQWKEEIYLTFDNAVPNLQFSAFEYSGKIGENQPIGTEVVVPVSFDKSMHTFPAECVFGLESGDSNAFQLGHRSNGELSFLSAAVFDRESREMYSFLVTAACPGGMNAHSKMNVLVTDMNDNAPEFEKDFYTVNLKSTDLTLNKEIIQVEAIDADQGNKIIYSLENNDFFVIDPKLGTVTLIHPELITKESYKIKVFAQDAGGLIGIPATLYVTIDNNPVIIFEEIDIFTVHQIQKRAVARDDRTFVVRDNMFGNLFSVAPVPRMEGEMYYFVDPAPENLVLNSVSGMVTREINHVWNTSMAQFAVNVTLGEETDDMLVTVYIESNLNWESPILTNEPLPLMARVPIWIRPYTTIFIAQAKIVEQYGVDVEYKIESGSEGRFYIEPASGEVKIQDRGEFKEGYTYKLAISAQTVGNARRTDTPAQVVMVQVEDMKPQFYLDPYIINVPETSLQGQVVDRIRVKSFQELPLTYSIQFDKPSDANLFTVNSRTGEVTLGRSMAYIQQDRVQFRGSVTVLEDASMITNTIDLIINLVAENLHTPFFPAAHYLRTGVSEDIPIGSTILDVLAVDLDPGDFGLMDFTVNDPRFEIVSTDGKTGILETIGEMDYDTAGPEHKYEFTIVATDRDPVNPRSGTATVQVYLDNVEDEVPVFYPEEQVVFVTELTPASTPFLYYLQAYDPDHPIDGELTFAFRNVGDCAGGTASTCDIFDLDQNTGKLTLRIQVPQGKANMVVTLMVNDGSQSTEGTVTVNFVGVNHPPIFPQCNSYRDTATIREGLEPGTSIINVTTVDNDAGVNGQLKFSLVQDHRFDAYFGLNQLSNNMAEIYSLRKFDREAPFDGVALIGGQIRYRVTVLAEDQGNPTLSSTCFFFITIWDENDNPPRFDDGFYSIDIDRQTQLQQEFLRVYAIDDDQGTNAEVTYSIPDPPNMCNAAPCFSIDSSSGWIKINAAIPDSLRKVELKVRAEDRGSTPLSEDVDVTVNFYEEGDPELPPNWDQVNGQRIDDLDSISILENVALGTKLDLSFKAVLPGLDGEVTYLLSRGRTEQENFARDFNNEDNVADQSMNLLVIQNLEYERVSKYILKLRASRRKVSGASYKDARLQVTIIDVNDKIPEFEGLDRTGNIPAAVSDQTRRNDVVLTVIAIDLDGVSPNNKVTYKWGDDCSDCAAFMLDADTGDIIANRDLYDREVQSEYILSLIAEDGAPSAIRSDGEPNRVHIDVTVLVLGPSQDSPKFNKNRYEVQIDEGQPLFTPVAMVTAEDPDPKFNYPQYMISEGNGDHLFVVDTTNGTIYNTGYLMYPIQKSYAFTYNVFDGRNIASTTVILNITSLNIHPPKFVSDIIENRDHTEETTIDSPLLLASASAIDPDSTRPEQLVYSIEGVLMQNNFQIDADGNVYLLTPGQLDRDYPNGYTNWQYNLVAHDEGSSSSESKKGYAVMNIYLKDLNDNAPVFDACCFEGSVPENSDAGTSVMNLVANDVDEGENGRVTYELLSSPGTPALFAVSGDGVVTTTGSNSLNREIQDNYEIIVRARDNGPQPIYSAENQTIYITVTDVNDNNPMFVNPPYAINMPEEIPVGGSVVDILGEDADIGENSRLTFEIESGDDDNHFYFDDIYVAEAGVLKIAKKVDYDTMTNPTFNLRITVRDPDRAGSNSPTNLVITVFDVNDNAPLFSPAELIVSTISEDDPVGQVVTDAFTVTDPDTGLGGVFSYSIDYENSDPMKKFAVNPDNGVVTIRKSLDFEQENSYELHVLATDQGEPPQTGTGTIFVNLRDVNEHAPDIQPTDSPITVGENTRRSDVVARITAFDLDDVENGPPFTFQYDCNDVQCEDFQFQFVTDGNGTGILTANVDGGYNRYERGRKYYELGILMRDNPTSGQDSMSALRTLRVNIESLNDRMMQQEGSTKYVEVFNYDEKFDDIPCGSVYVNDQDDDDLSDKTFTCVEGCSETVEGTTYINFKVSANLGEVTMNGGTPKGLHTLRISVFDKHWQQTITATMNVDVIYIYGDAVLSSGSMRLSETSGAELVRRAPESPSKLQKFRTTLAGLLDVPEGNVQVFSVLPVPEEDSMVDVQFSAHGSPHYSPARMNGIVLANKGKIQEDAGVTVAMSPVDLCYKESCFSGGCDNRVVIQTKPALVNTNSASFVGVNTTYDYVCECPSHEYSDTPPVCEANSCYNDGECVETWNGFSCNCPRGFDGPRCQSTHLNLNGNSWAWFETLGTSQCGNSRLSFDFITTQGNGLFLYNGPLENPDPQIGVTDFIAIWLDNGYVRGRINLGDATANLFVSGANGADTLNDGKWHTIEFIREMRTLRLIVDHCMASSIEESVNETTENREKCESRVEYSGEMFLLNVLSPLEVGGRSNTNYPSNLPKAGFNGCMKNLMYDDKLYDLSVSRTQIGGSPSNVCDRERGCAADGACPVNSTCIGNFNDVEKQCICDSGWSGDNCDIATTIKDIEEDEGFIEWALESKFNTTLMNRAVEIQIQYRSRQEDGMLFTASSFSKLEHLKLDLVETHLRFRYDLGSDERDLWLSYVNASDGLWHVVTITRYGNQVILKMDQGEGKYYNESLPTEEHRLISIHDTRQTYGGAEVYYKKYVTEPIVSDVLVASCVTDIRVDNTRFPLAQSDQSEAAMVVQAPHTIDTCKSDACIGVTCPVGQSCVDRWRMPFCVCAFGEVFRNGVCVPLTDCSLARCGHGYCVVYENNWRCICDEGWSGLDCNTAGPVVLPTSVGITDGALAAIIVAILALIFLVLVALFCLLSKRQKDPLLVDPDDDIRENIVYYDEEGAGEEDMHAYDLSRLQKPVGPGGEPSVMPAGNPSFPTPSRDMPLHSGVPEPMHNPRMPFRPGENPDVGDFIGDRLGDADDDPNAPPYDSVREYEYEGSGSTAGSLSSIQSSSSGDLDFDYLNNLGPNFQKLADMYGAGQGSEED